MLDLSHFPQAVSLPTRGMQQTTTKTVGLGGDFLSLRDALASAQAGWTIYIRPGTYYEMPITCNLNNISIVGDGAEQTVLDFGANDCIFNGTNIHIQGIKLAFGHGMFQSNGTKCEILYNHFTKAVGASNRGVLIQGANTLFSGNYCISSVVAITDDFVYVGGTYSRVTNNTVALTGGYNGALVAASNFMVVAGNHILVTAGGSTAKSALVVSGTQTIVSGNYIDQSGSSPLNQKGIQISGGSNPIVGNSIRNFLYGIYTTGTFNTITGNNIVQPGGSPTAGIELVNGSGVVSGNFLQGQTAGIGIESQSNLNSITGNFLSGFGTGITTGAGTTNNSVVGNIFSSCTANMSLGSSSGVGYTTAMGNSGADQNQQQDFAWMKNTSGGSLAAGDVVVLKAVAAGDEVTTTTAAGDSKVFGVAATSISNNAYGAIFTSGKNTISVDGTGTAIAVGDFLSCHTTAKKAVKAITGDTAIAIALAASTTSNTISSQIINPLKI